MQKKRLFSNPNRKKLIIDNQVYTKNFTGPQASHIIYFCERAYAVAYGAYWIAPIARGNTARNGASPLFWRVYALHTPRVSYGMTEDIKRFDMEIQLLKDIDDAVRFVMPPKFSASLSTVTACPTSKLGRNSMATI